MGAFKNSWMYVIFPKLDQHVIVNEMMAVNVKFSEFLMIWFSHNLIKSLHGHQCAITPLVTWTGVS